MGDTALAKLSSIRSIPARAEPGKKLEPPQGLMRGNQSSILASPLIATARSIAMPPAIMPLKAAALPGEVMRPQAFWKLELDRGFQLGAQLGLD